MADTSQSKYKRVSKEKFVDFLKNYPTKLVKDVYGVCDPPYISYNDFSTGKMWPDSVVAYTFLYDPNPGDYFYEPENERKYYILKTED